jgi:hypothetical protein
MRRRTTIFKCTENRYPTISSYEIDEFSVLKSDLQCKIFDQNRAPSHHHSTLFIVIVGKSISSQTERFDLNRETLFMVEDGGLGLPCLIKLRLFLIVSSLDS